MEKGERGYIMTVKTLRNRINSLHTHVLFDYDGKECGILLIRSKMWMVYNEEI